VKRSTINQKTVHSILHHVAETTHKDLEQLYIEVGWPLYKKYGHAYDAFKLAIGDPTTAFAVIPMDPQLQEVLLSNIKRRLTPQPVKVRGDVEVTCFKYEGIDAIRAALQKGEETSTPEAPIKIKLVAPPLYVVVTTSLNKEIAIKGVNIAIEAVKQQIVKSGGDLSIKVAARTVHERDERALSSLMEKLEKENADRPADDQESSGEEDND